MTMRFTGDADRGATRIEERCGYRRDSNRASPNEERLLQQSSDTGWEHACAFDRKSVHLACLSVSLALYSVAWYGSDLRVKPDPDGRDQSSSHTSSIPDDDEYDPVKQRVHTEELVPPARVKSTRTAFGQGQVARDRCKPETLEYAPA